MTKAMFQTTTQFSGFGNLRINAKLLMGLPLDLTADINMVLVLLLIIEVSCYWSL